MRLCTFTPLEQNCVHCFLKSSLKGSDQSVYFQTKKELRPFGKVKLHEDRSAIQK